MLKRSSKGFSLRDDFKRGRGFSLIELIVVIAIIGVLVMLATPKFLGYVERAELKRIQHDVKVMEGKMEEAMIHDKEEFLSWDDNIKDLRLLVVAKQLFDTEGVARKVDKLSSLRFGPTASLEGVPSVLSHTEGEHRDYKVIPTNMKKHIKSSLPGTFYSNINGKVYYEHNKPLKSAEEEIVLRCEAPKPLDYTFDHLTGTIVKYHGNLQHLIIPAAFEVDGVCWPVRIIGKGAFQIGNYTGPEEEQPIKSVVIPPSVEIIEEDAFKGNELENVEIPPSVEDIEKDAFKDNKIPNKPEEGSGGPGGAIIKKEPEDIEIDGSAFDNNGPNGDEKIEPSFEPSTDKDLDVTINIKTDKDGDKFGSIGDYNGGGTSIVIPPTIIVDGEKVPVKEIDEGAFQGKGLITVGLPFGLERIEDYAFAGNQLIATIIPETVVHIGNYAFAFNEVRHTKNSKITKDTIKSIIIQTDEYIKALDKVGNITSDGNKVDMIKNKTRLLDHIYITSNSKIVIGTGNDNVDDGDLSINDELIADINKDIGNIKNEINDLTSISTEREISIVENKISQIQTKINKLDNNIEKDKLQSALDKEVNKVNQIRIIKEISSSLVQIGNKVANEDLGNIDILVSGVQNNIDKLIDSSSYQLELDNLKQEIEEIRNRPIESTDISKVDDFPESFTNTKIQSYIENNYIVIANLNDLNKIGNDRDYPLSGKYIQVSDIDLSRETNFEPIGSSANKFTGEYNGANFQIKNLTISNPEQNQQGLFAFTDGAIITNLGLTDVSVIGSRGVGGIVGWANNTSFDTVYVTGTVEADSVAGLLAGFQSSRTVTNSYSKGSIFSEKGTVGGLFGSTSSSTINNSYSTANVEGNFESGGLLGYKNRGSLNNSYSLGEIKGGSRVAGLIGSTNSGARVTKSFSLGEVKPRNLNSSGVLFGEPYLYENFKINATHSYYEIIEGNPSDERGGKGIHTSEISNQASYVGFDFLNTWKLNDAGHPVLQWQK